MSEGSAYEQYMLELINEDRAKAGVQPLAFNTYLNDSSEDHSAWMLANDIFSHTGVTGTSAFARMQAAGYQFIGSWGAGENVGYTSIGNPAGYVDELGGLHAAFMNSAGHRANILRSSFKEVGIGFEVGDFGGYTVAMVTEDFAWSNSGAGSFITGVAFDDSDGDRFYDVGEALGGLSVTAVSSSGVHYTTITAPAGGYQLLVPAGTYTVTFSGSSIAPATFQKTVGNLNVKLDLIGSAPVSSSIDGDAANNTLIGTANADTIRGFGGNDRLSGLGGDDTLEGGDGSDVLDGGTGGDTLLGGSGNDTYIVDNALDAVWETTVVGGTTDAGGIDTVQSTVSYTLPSFVENLILMGTAAVNGTGNSLHNFLIGNSAANTLSGGAGNDTLKGGAGNDILDGGTGTDTASYGDKSAPVVVSLNGSTAATVFVGGVAEDTIRNIENLIGGSAGDTLRGDGGVNLLQGIYGNDFLDGGAGVDTLVGGPGQDTFFFASTAEAGDTITDFNPVDDVFRLENSGFGAGVGTGTLAQAGVDFVLGSAATTANETLFYNQATGQLFWDANGTGAGGVTLIANLTNKAALTAADFIFV